MKALSRAQSIALFVTLAGMLVLSVARAAPVTFSTTGAFSISGTNVVNFTNVNGTTTLTFNGASNSVNTPAGTSFGDLVVTTTVPPNLLGPAIGGTFSLNILQVSPAGAGSIVGTLSGTIGFNTGVATLTFGSTMITIGGFTYTVNSVYTIELPVTGTGAGAATGTTTIQGTVTGGIEPPNVNKQFFDPTIPLGGTTRMTITITNPNPGVALSNVSFTDTLQSGLVVANSPGVVNSCGGTLTATAGTSIVDLFGGDIAADDFCSIDVYLTGTTAGVKNNSVVVGSAEGGLSQASSDSVTVVSPPSISKLFTPAAIALNGTSSLTFTITNTNALALTGVGFTDTLPTGLTVASVMATVCGGTLTTTAPTGIALTGASIGGNGTCQFSITVTGAATGAYTNTTGPVVSANGGDGNTASAPLTVASPPQVAKQFTPATVALGGTSTLSFLITNLNQNVALTGIAFTDTLPTGVVVGASTVNTCGGMLSAPQGGSSISLTGGTVAAGVANCVVTVAVEGTIPGVQTNSVQVTSAQGTGNTSTATLTIVAPPVVSKSFDKTRLAFNETATLTFTITNPSGNAVPLTNVGFTDLLGVGAAPSLVVASPNGLNGSCGGGVITATPGSTQVSLSGATIPVNGSCSFSVDVAPVGYGILTNSVTVTSDNGGAGNTATASIELLQMAIPVLQGWMLLLLVVVMGSAMGMALARRRA